MTDVRGVLNNIAVPETFRCTTDSEVEEEIVRLKDEFFTTVQVALGFTSLRNVFFKEKQYYLMGEYAGHESDDKSWVLTWEGNEQLAAVHDMRSNANAHSVTFMLNANPSDLLCEQIDYQARVLAAIDAGEEEPVHPAELRLREEMKLFDEGLFD